MGLPGGCINSLQSMQRAWDDEVCSKRLQLLLIESQESDRARLLACSAPSAGLWLHALPTPSLGLRLTNSDIRLSICLWVGSPLVSIHTCVCGALVQIDGLSCRRSAGRQSRHHAANDIIARTFRRVGVPSILEPPGLIRGDGTRPDRATQIPWTSGRPLLWDFTCPDTLAPSHIRKSSFFGGGGRCRSTEDHKILRIVTHTLICTGSGRDTWSLGAEAEKLLKELGRRMAEVTQDARSKSFLRQQIDVAIQRGSALSIMGPFPIATSPLDVPFTWVAPVSSSRRAVW